MKRQIYSPFTDTVQGSTSPILTPQEIADLTSALDQIVADDILSASEKVRTFINEIQYTLSLYNNLRDKAVQAGLSVTDLDNTKNSLFNYLGD